MSADKAVEVGGGDARGGKLFRHGGMEMGMGNWRIRFRDQMGIGFGRGDCCEAKKKRGASDQWRENEGPRWQSGEVRIVAMRMIPKYQTEDDLGP